MALDWSVIRGPLEVHGVRSQAEYARKHRAQLAALRQRGVTVAEWNADPRAAVLISGGKWVVQCACGNAPSASVEWNEARCFDCGAVFHDLAWPTDPEAVADALLARPVANRHWTLEESVDDLIAENIARGVVARPAP